MLSWYKAQKNGRLFGVQVLDRKSEVEGPHMSQRDNEIRTAEAPKRTAPLLMGIRFFKPKPLQVEVKLRKLRPFRPDRRTAQVWRLPPGLWIKLPLDHKGGRKPIELGLGFGARGLGIIKGT